MADYCDTPAVLVLALAGGPSLDLMSDQNGFRIDTVDLGFPDVREDTDPNADQRGLDDYTRLYGGRAVSLAGSIVPSPAGSRQKALHALAPFLDPAGRPTLTYQIDADTTPRVLTLRASAFSAPFVHPAVSAFTVGWKAPDPAAYDATVKQAIARVSSAGQTGGRAYPLTFNRTYPAGGGSNAVATNAGDLVTYPLLRVYGPIVNPSIQAAFTQAGVTQYWTLGFTYTVNAGDFIEVDCFARTAFVNGDHRQSVYSTIVFNNSGAAFPFMPPGVAVTFSLYGTGASTPTVLQVNWQDAYLI